MKKLLGLLALLVFSQFAASQTAVLYRVQTLTSATTGAVVNNIGGRSLYMRLYWNPINSPGACTIALDSSVDNVTWVSGNVFGATSCTSPSSVTASVSAVYNYVRVTVSALTAGKSVSYTIAGYESQPSESNPVGPTFNCNLSPGANAGEKINACIAGAPVGSTLDASSIAAGVVTTSKISVNKNVKLIVNNSLTFFVNPGIEVSANAEIGCYAFGGSSASNCSFVAHSTAGLPAQQTGVLVDVLSGASPNIHDINFINASSLTKTGGSGLQLRSGAGGVYTRLRFEKTWIGINQAEGGSTGIFRDIYFGFQNAANGAWYSLWAFGGCTGVGTPAELNCNQAISATITDQVIENVTGASDSLYGSGAAFLIDGGTDSLRMKNITVTSTGTCLTGNCGYQMLVQNAASIFSPSQWFRCDKCVFEGATAGATTPLVGITAGTDIRFFGGTAMVGGTNAFLIKPGTAARQWVQGVTISETTIFSSLKEGILLSLVGGATVGPNGEALSEVYIHDNTIGGTSASSNGTYAAVSVEANVNDFYVYNNTFDPYVGALAAFPSHFVKVAAGTSNFYGWWDNRFNASFRVTADYSDGGTGLTKVLGPNFGTTSVMAIPLYGTTSNCIDSAGAAACGSAAAGSFVIDAAGTSTVVSTTAVTANSQIFLTNDSSLGTRLSVTCNTQSSLVLGTPRVTARTAATSFTATIDVGPTTNPMCLSYFIIN